MPSGFAEDLPKSEFNTPSEFAIETARHKAVDVWNVCTSTDTPPDLVIAADTVVIGPGEEILGKPLDKEDAFNMLRKLSGTTHSVISACAFCYRPKSSKSSKVDSNDISFATHTFAVAATVHFALLSDAEIQAYVATQEPMGKAGSYGIQGIGGALISGIEGDYYTVMGMPLHGFCKEMQQVILPELL